MNCTIIKKGAGLDTLHLNAEFKEITSKSAFCE